MTMIQTETLQADVKALVESVVMRVVEHDYPHAYVRLHFCKVTAWDGTLRALEGQDFAWQTLPISVDPVLPATLPVFEWMREERETRTAS